MTKTENADGFLNSPLASIEGELSYEELRMQHIPEPSSKPAGAVAAHVPIPQGPLPPQQQPLIEELPAKANSQATALSSRSGSPRQGTVRPAEPEPEAATTALPQDNFSFNFGISPS